ncbi:MAG: radical SAM protein [Candidatus Bathyarchaeota archaeon]|nr:radical SAM protein [Candidatus Bathyarchaeota archaeon]
MEEYIILEKSLEQKKKTAKERYLKAGLSLVKSRLYTGKPFFLAHAITYSCNSRCKTCTYWQMSNRTNADLSTEEVFDLLDEAYDFGMRGYYLFGGEPTVRSDIGKIVDYAKQKGFLTTMNTNASLLKEKAESLRNLDFVFVSLDYFNNYHDFIRGRRGSFREVVDGIKRIREVGNTRVTLVTTISRLNFEAIEPMARFARALNVGISYNAVEPTVKSGFEDGRTESPVLDWGLSDEQLEEFYLTLLKLKREGFPLMETRYVLKHFVEGRAWTCRFPKMFVYVSADKKIFNCTYDHTYDLKQGSFNDYFKSKLYLDHVARAEKCNICVRTCVRGYSYAYDLLPLNFVNLLGDAGILLRGGSN